MKQLTISMIGLIIILTLTSTMFAHSESEPDPHTIENGHTQSEIEELTKLEKANEVALNQRSSQNGSVWPWIYFANGNIWGGLFAIVVWVAAIHAFYQLIILVVGRHL